MTQEQSKATPGPWIARRCYTTRPEPDMEVMADGGETYIAQVSFSDDPKHHSFINDVEEMRANARLIAAAPDLLNALDEAVTEESAHQHSCSWLEKARAAIAKATGEAAK